MLDCVRKMAGHEPGSKSVGRKNPSIASVPASRFLSGASVLASLDYVL